MSRFICEKSCFDWQNLNSVSEYKHVLFDELLASAHFDSTKKHQYMLPILSTL